MKKTFICVTCPNGCEIEVEYSGKDISSISGNLCPKGVDYVRQELFSPMRSIASLVSVGGGVLPLVSVKTSRTIPKEKIFEVMNALADVEVSAPVEIGDVVVRDVAGTKADIVATKNVAEK